MFGPLGLFPQPWMDPMYFYNEILGPRHPGSPPSFQDLPLPLKLQGLFRAPGHPMEGGVRPLLPWANPGLLGLGGPSLLGRGHVPPSRSPVTPSSTKSAPD